MANKKGSGLAARRPGLVEITCLDTDRFVTASDTDVWSTYDRLAALDTHATRVVMDRQQRAAGLNLNPNGVLADVALRDCVGPVSSLTYDWQHTKRRSPLLTNGSLT